MFLCVALCIRACPVDQAGPQVRDASASFLLPPPPGFVPVFIDAKSKGCGGWDGVGMGVRGFHARDPWLAAALNLQHRGQGEGGSLSLLSIW